MATISQAKDSLISRLNTLVDSNTFTKNDTILATNAIETLESATSNETVKPPPQFHYRSTRPEFAVWHGYSTHNGGATTVDKYGIPHRMRCYFSCHYYDGGESGCYWGPYTSGTKEQAHGDPNYCHSHVLPGTGDNCYINGTTSVGELGHYRLNIGYRALESYNNDTEGPARLLEMPKVGNGEIDDADTYLTYDGTVIKHKYRHATVDQTPLSEYTVPSAGDSSYGSLSYNKTRGELVVHNRDTSDPNFNFRISIYKSISHIDKDTRLDARILEANRVQLLYQMASGYTSTDSETYENNKVVLTDNGTIYVSTMNPSSSAFHLHFVTRDANDTTLTYDNSPGSQALYSSISGRTQSANHGQRLQQSRDRKNVLLFCAYAYFNQGFCSWIVDKTRNTHYQGFYQNWTGQPVTSSPYGNRDFAFVRAQNWDWVGNQSLVTMIQKPDGSWVETDIGNQLDNGGWISTTYPAMVPIQP